MLIQLLYISELDSIKTFQDLLSALQSQEIEKFYSILPLFSCATEITEQIGVDMKTIYYSVLMGAARSKNIFDNENIWKVRYSNVISLKNYVIEAQKETKLI